MTRRLRAVAPLALLVGAAALAAAAFAPWWRRIYDDPLTGPVTVTLDGGQVWPALVPVALVAAAGLGAASLATGIIRRMIGVILACAGLAGLIVLGSSLGTPPVDGFASQLVRPAAPLGDATLAATAPLAGLAGAIFVIIGGSLYALMHPPGRRQAHGSPAARRAGARGTSGGASDGADLWHALDDGVDPTEADPDGAVKGPVEDRYDESI